MNKLLEAVIAVIEDARRYGDGDTYMLVHNSVMSQLVSARLEAERENKNRFPSARQGEQG